MDVFDGPTLSEVRTQGSYIAPLGDQMAAGATYDDVSLDHTPKPDEASTLRNRAAAEALLGAPVGGAGAP